MRDFIPRPVLPLMEALARDGSTAHAAHVLNAEACVAEYLNVVTEANVAGDMEWAAQKKVALELALAKAAATESAGARLQAHRSL